MHRWGRRSRVIPCETAPWSVPGAGRAAAASERSAGRRRGRGRAGRGLPQPGVAGGGGVGGVPRSAAGARRAQAARESRPERERAVPAGARPGPRQRAGSDPSPGSSPRPCRQGRGQAVYFDDDAGGGLGPAGRPAAGVPRLRARRAGPGRQRRRALAGCEGVSAPPERVGPRSAPGGGGGAEAQQLPRQGCCPPAASQQRTGEQDALSARTFHLLRKCGPAAWLLGKPRARDAVPAARAGVSGWRRRGRRPAGAARAGGHRPCRRPQRGGEPSGRTAALRTSRPRTLSWADAIVPHKKGLT